ncbi:MAG TPA: DUF6049 family protein [Acidimicrobiales bacterium]|nr:DUF6049 family protein [Acidimicrobiales bacterium]
MIRPARLLAAALLLALSLSGTAAAQDRDGDNRLTLASKTPWVGRGGELVLRVHADAADPAETELAVAVHARITSRSRFVRTLEGDPQGSPLTVVSAPLTQLGPDPAGALSVKLPVQDPAQPRDAGRLLLSRDGVYPVRVELRELGGGEVLAGFTTHLIYATENPARKPLGIALVLPFHAPPTTAGDGTRTLPDLDPLRAVADALAAHRGVPLTVDPTPETVEALAQAAQGEGDEILGDLRAAMSGREVVSNTYVVTDPRSLLDAGLRDELTAQRARARQVLEEVLGVRADPRSWVLPAGVDGELLDLARAGQVDRVVVEESALEPANRAVTLAQPFSLEARRSAPAIAALASDPGLADHFRDHPDRGEAGPVLAAHQLLADLAVIQFDSPGTERAAVARAPAGWRPTAAFLEALLSGIAQSPLVEPVTLDEAFDVPPAESASGARLVRRAAQAEDPEPLSGRGVRSARGQLEAFGSLVDPANPVEVALDRALLSSQAAGMSQARRRALIDSVASGIEAQFSRISLPGNRSVTLTARAGEIPITIQSQLDYPVRAVLRVDSDKLAFPDGDRREVELANTNTTERFSVRARTSGAFPVRVVLESPEGDLVLGRSLFTVRSTAASGVGVALSMGAVGFLALWWGGHVVQARRKKHEPVTDPIEG